MIFATTPSQTVGPYFAIELPWPEGPHAVAGRHPGGDHHHRDGVRRRRRPGARPPDRDLAGRSRRPVRRSVTATAAPRSWPAFAASRATASRTATARSRSSPSSPGPVPAPDGTLQAPHIDVSVFARGMLNRCVTRIYFADEEQANAADPVLARVPAQRRQTLIARADRGGLPLRHPPPGPGRDGLLCRLSWLCSLACTRAVATAVELDDRAWLRAMLDVEAALARACAGEGLIPSAVGGRDRSRGGGSEPLRSGRRSGARRRATPRPVDPAGGAAAGGGQRAGARPTSTSAPPARTSSTPR